MGEPWVPPRIRIPEEPWCYPPWTDVNRFFRSALFPLIVIVLLVYLASQTLLPGRGEQRKITYSDAKAEVRNGNVNEVLFTPTRQSLTLTLVDGDKVKVNYPTPQSATQFENLLEEENVKFDSKGTGSSTWWSLLISVLPFVILIGFWIFLMNQMQGGGSKVMSFGKSRAKRMTPDSPKIGFKDVAGVDEAVEATGAQQGGVEDVGTVGRGDQDDAAAHVEAVHLHEQLVQRLLALVVAAAHALSLIHI